MYAYLYFPDGSSVTALETTDGWPIIPNKGDWVERDKVVYRVKSISWNYDLGNIDVFCEIDRPDEKLYHDDMTLQKVYAAILKETGLETRTIQNVINEMQNNGILFRERVKNIPDYRILPDKYANPD